MRNRLHYSENYFKFILKVSCSILKKLPINTNHYDQTIYYNRNRRAWNPN
jgi:hypothetical protein